jgi:hypothetical protein
MIYTVRGADGTEKKVKAENLGRAEADGFYPVVSNGSEEKRVKSANLDKAKASGFSLKGVETPTAPEVDTGDKAIAALSGFSKGATMGFGDEIVGTAKGIGDYLLGKAAYALEGVPYDQGTFAQNVNRNVSQERAIQEQAQKQAPGYALAGQVVGGVAGGVKLPTKGVAQIPALLGVGAVQGVGEGNSDIGLDTVKDVGLGAGGAALGYGVGKTVGAVGKGVKSVLQGKPIEKTATFATEVIGELPSEVGKKIIKNPNLAAEGKGLTALGEDLVKTTNGLKQQMLAESDNAWEILKQSKVGFDPAQFKGLTAKIAQDRGIAGSSQGAQKQALKALMDAEKDLRTATNWEGLKKVVRQIDDNIDWNTPGRETTNDALIQLRSQVDDILKTANPDYATAMRPVAEKASQLNQITRAMKLGKGPEGYEVTDQTINSLKSLTRDMAKDVKPKLKETMGTVSKDLVEDLETESLSKATRQDIGRGSRSALTGAATGAAAGSMIAGPVGFAVGGGLGAIAGFTRDKYGRQLAANALKWGGQKIQNQDAVLARIGDTWDNLSPQAKEAIVQASLRGPAAMTSTWAVMKDK